MITNLKFAYLLATLALLGALATGTAVAAGDPERGKPLAYTCLGCHGIEGYRNAYPSYRVPKLGGQRAAYIATALRGYRDGLRQHTTMQAHAQSLTDQEIDDISAYLATLNNDTIADGGSKDVAPPPEAATCAACHGQNGIGVSPDWPTLAGQHEEYLVHALNAYRNGSRKQAVMVQMAAGLSDKDVETLSAWYARLKGLETTQLQ